MQQVAVFVDAGYVYAQGGLAISGHYQARGHLTVKAEAFKTCLNRALESRCPGRPLLRIYWYDAAPGPTRLTADQMALAYEDDVKLRLGTLNAQGQQKGIDSLIVTDLIELARNGAISDAVLVSGDADLRVGVQIAQSYGVRVHLIGVAAVRASLSPLLAQESDTKTEWRAEDVEAFLAIHPGFELAPPEPGQEGEPPLDPRDITADAIAGELAAELSEEDVAWLLDAWTRAPGIPPDLDRRMLARWGAALDRDVTLEEKRQLRASFRAAVNARGPRLA